MNNFGYCCISIGINEGKRKKDQISVNRSMIKKTFDLKGLSYVSELIELNLNDTIKIIEWNLANDIKVYRMSSDSFPWMTHFKLSDLPNYDFVYSKLLQIGDIIKKNQLRVSFHPGPFCVLASQNEEVVQKTIDELDKHAQLMDMMGLEQSHFYPINIHVGTTKPNKEEAAARFCHNFTKLAESTKRRLTIENDDAPSQFSVTELYNWIHKVIGIPIVIDSLHWSCHDDGLSWIDSLNLAVSTWSVKPIAHHSSSKKLHEESAAKLEAHADWLYEAFDSCGHSMDIELECKQKDLALLRYRQEFLKS